jgi:zinc transport system ATP-binding protein
LPLDHGTIIRRPGLRAGYVPQRFSIDKILPLDVKRLMTLTEAHTASEIENALDATGIGGLIDAPVDRLSGGEIQRALLARAILREPDLLVLDEPVQGVDFAGQIDMFEHIRSVRDRLSCGVLLVSHDLHLVMAETDRVVCLNGHVCCSGTPQSVSKSSEYLQLFGPRAVQALAVYHHDHDHAHGPDGGVVPLDGGSSPEQDGPADNPEAKAVAR